MLSRVFFVISFEKLNLTPKWILKSLENKVTENVGAKSKMTENFTKRFYENLLCRIQREQKAFENFN